MPSLSKKYKINYNKRYTIQKNKKLRGNKSIKVYNNRVKLMSRKRKPYIGGDIKVPSINNIFPSGQTYQPNTDCLEKECYKKDDAGKKTTTCLNTLVIMNLFSQNLDASEEKTRDRIGKELTTEEKEQVKDLTEKYLTNYVSSLFSKSIFSKNNVDLTPGNTQKLKELLEVIKPKYVDYLTRDSNLSDDIKEKVLAAQQAVQEESNVVDNASTPAPAAPTAPIDNAIAPAPTSAPATIDNAVIEAERLKKATEDAEAERVKKAAEDAEVAKKAAEDAEAAKKAAEDAEAERLRVIAEVDKANKVYEDANKEANQIRTAAVEIANQDLETNIQKKDRRYAFKHDRALKLAKDAETATKKKAETAKNKAIAEAVKAENTAIDAIKRKLLAKKNLLASQTTNKP